MKQLVIFISVVILLGSCKSRLDEVPEAPLAVKGYLFGGEKISDISVEKIITSRDFVVQENEPVETAEVLLYTADTLIHLIPNPDREGFYYHPEYEVEVNKTYFLEVDYLGEKLKSSCSVPDFLEIESNFEEITEVGGSEVPETIVTLNWMEQEGFEYLLDLSAQDETLVPLAFNSSALRFEDRYSTPFKNTSAEIKDIDFTYKGLHKLTVYTLSPEYSTYVKYGPSNFDRSLFTAPNNIENGYGVFAGLTGTSIEITLVE